MKERVARRLAAEPWLSAVQESLGQALSQLRFRNGAALELARLRELYDGERLDLTSHFDNVLMLREIGQR